MKSSGKSRTRQKACDACASNKTRCIRQAGRCIRCIRKDLECTFPGTQFIVNGEPDATAQVSPDSTTRTLDAYSLPSPASLGPSSVNGTLLISSEGTNPLSPTSTIEIHPRRNAVLDFTNLQMICPIDASDISNRWLKAYIPDPANKAKQYSGPTVSFIYRLLKSFAGGVVRGEGFPTFVHPLQLSDGPLNSPLPTCINLARILNGSRQNIKPLSDILLQEMAKLYEDHIAFDAYFTVAAFQAYAIYTLVLFFHVSETHECLYQAMINLQVLASASARMGCMCKAEQDRTRPRWEEWITAEAQRRTLYAMYMFDSILSSRDGLPTFLGTELKGLPAPCAGILWRAANRITWETDYIKFLASWPDGILGLHELWPMPEDFDEPAVQQQRARVDRWLVNLDEYGTMLYAVTSTTHGS